jgi:hypothetical protein
MAGFASVERLTLTGTVALAYNNRCHAFMELGDNQ